MQKVTGMQSRGLAGQTRHYSSAHADYFDLYTKTTGEPLNGCHLIHALTYFFNVVGWRVQCEQMLC